MWEKAIKLWHDDVRPAPEGWTWARTNDEAKQYLGTGLVTEISMDHDLGVPAPATPIEEMTREEFNQWMSRRGNGPETGEDLARWMAREGIIPTKITIHSWNPSGAERMAGHLLNAGGDVRISPFQLDDPFAF
jgi:Cyclic-phosphate processing Receiver domain